jgi:hypothetical protein
MTAKGSRKIARRYARTLVALVLAALGGQFLFAQVASDPAVDQISALLQEKETRTSDQQKLDSQLWYALQASRGQTIAGVSEVYATAVDTVQSDVAGLTRVDISANVSDDLLNQIAALGGSVSFSSTQDQMIHATVPLAELETLATSPDVLHIAPAAQVRTNVGALTSQGYISHRANQVLSTLGKNGSGVKVGVLSPAAIFPLTRSWSRAKPARRTARAKARQ